MRHHWPRGAARICVLLHGMERRAVSSSPLAMGRRKRTRRAMRVLGYLLLQHSLTLFLRRRMEPRNYPYCLDGLGFAFIFIYISSKLGLITSLT